jgi:hypothetical protein
VAATSAPSQTSLYLYGITVADGMPYSIGGVRGVGVETLVEGNLAAIVSRLDAARVRPERANLAAHHRVLRDLAEERPVLPAVFGTIADSERGLRDVLRQNCDALAASLQRLRGKVEMGLKVYWDLPNVFEYFVATHQELETMRNRLFRPGRTPTVEEKVALGELFVSLLQQARQRHTRRVRETLAACSAEVRAIDPGDERMIMKLACLVDRDRQQDWEEAVRQAARLFDDHYRFDYNGPWPPYNFTQVELELT